MRVLITGTAGGIGRAIAQKFLDEGHTVFGMDRMAGTIMHDMYTHYQTDIFKGELPQLPAIEILINNAGVQNSGEDIDINSHYRGLRYAGSDSKRFVYCLCQCAHRGGIS